MYFLFFFWNLLRGSKCLLNWEPQLVFAIRYLFTWISQLHLAVQFHLYKNPDNLFVWISTLQELDQNIENLQNDKKQLNSQLEGKSAEISTLTGRIKEQEKNLGEKLMEIVRLQSVVDDLKDQLEDVLISYENDRDWWKQRADKVLG